MPARPSPVLDRIRWCSRAARLALEDPVEGLDRALLRLARHSPERIEPSVQGERWEPQVHARLGANWPCPDCESFSAVFADTVAHLQAGGHAVGRGTFGGWDDADNGFARAVWCLAFHLRPRIVVETGVARGVTTRAILHALRLHGMGHLWSIDRPPLDPALHREIGAAVPAELRSRWTLVRGTSRRELPGLLRRLGRLDLFVHDSLHTERNVRFELRNAWASMAGAGALAVDDVERNPAFEKFLATAPVEGIVAGADDGRSYFGLALSV